MIMLQQCVILIINYKCKCRMVLHIIQINVTKNMSIKFSNRVKESIKVNGKHNNEKTNVSYFQIKNLKRETTVDN